MLLTEDLKVGLTPEQIQAIETTYTTKETELKALANKNADGIFNGAAQKLAEQTGIQKAEGEKYSDYFARLGTEWLPEQSKTKLAAAEEKVRLAEEKFANHKGDETLKIELQNAKAELAKIPELLTAKETEWKTKYEGLETTYKTFKFNHSISQAMPKFDDSVNQFELKAKQQNAIDRIKKTYELSYDENDNLIGTKDYQKYLISDLLKADEELKDLILIDQASGGAGGGGQKKTTALTIPGNISKAAGQQIVREFIKTVEQIDQLDFRYADRFKLLCKENNVL
jgi:hypothetical protein